MEGGGASAGNGAGTDGASDGAGERRGSKLSDLFEKKKKPEKKRRKADKQGSFICNNHVILQSCLCIFNFFLLVC